MGQEIIPFSFILIGTFPDKRLMVIEIQGLPVEIDMDNIYNIEFDDTNNIVHFDTDEKTAREYNL